MGKHVVTAFFVLIAAAVGKGALAATGNALADSTLESWLVAVYAVLKFIVAVAFTVFVIIRGPALRRARRPVAYLVCVGILLPALLKAPSQTAPPSLVILGELITVLGCAWMIVAALALGRCFGVLPEARGLVTHGPYSIIRHPLYLGELAAMAGLMIASPTVRNLAAGAAFVAIQVVRMRLEEQALTLEFPDYADYAAHTPRLIPSRARLLGPVGAGRRPARGRRSVAPVGEGGQAMVEYSIIIGLVAAVVVFALPPLGAAVADLLEPVPGLF